MVNLNATQTATLSATVTAATSGNLPDSANPAPLGPYYVVAPPAAGSPGGDLADASSEIQAAISKAAVAGGTVWLEPGTYGIGTALTLPSGVELAAAQGTVTLDALPGAERLLTISGTPGSDGAASPTTGAAVVGITFDGNATAVGNSSPLVVCWISQNIGFVDCDFENARGIGALVSDTSNCYFISDSFRNIGNFSAVTGKLLQDSSQGIAFCSDSAMASSGNRVIGCSFTAIGLDAVSATQQTNFVVASSKFSDLNVLSGWGNEPQGAAGVYLEGDSGAEVLGNSISGASGNGIDVANSGTIDIQSNSVNGNDESGITIASCNNVNITDNISINNNMLDGHFPHTAGITLTGGENEQDSNVLISGNALGNTDPLGLQEYGLQVDAGTAISGLALDDNSYFNNVLSAANIPLPRTANGGASSPIDPETINQGSPNFVQFATNGSISAGTQITPANSGAAITEEPAFIQRSSLPALYLASCNLSPGAASTMGLEVNAFLLAPTFGAGLAKAEPEGGAKSGVLEPFSNGNASRGSVASIGDGGESTSPLLVLLPAATDRLFIGTYFC